MVARRIIDSGPKVIDRHLLLPIHVIKRNVILRAGAVAGVVNPVLVAHGAEWCVIIRLDFAPCLIGKGAGATYTIRMEEILQPLSLPLNFLHTQALPKGIEV